MFPINNLFFYILIFIFAWLGTITFFGIRFLRSFKKLTSGVSDKDLKTILEEVLREIDLNKKEEKEILKRLEEQEEKNQFDIQKIGLVRYNPFSDTGGDQSFVLALLNGHDDGVVITSLHGRDQTRIFTKPVEKTKPSGYEFSKEETEAINKAKKGKIK